MSVLFRRKEHALEVPVPGAGLDLAVMAKAQAGLWVGGALLALVVAVLPPPREANTLGFLVVAGAATAAAGIINARAGTLPRWLLQLAPLVGTALISLCIFFSGERKGAPSTDNEMLYLWVALYSAYFFSLRQAALQVAWVALAYWDRPRAVRAERRVRRALGRDGGDPGRSRRPRAGAAEPARGPGRS